MSDVPIELLALTKRYSFPYIGCLLKVFNKAHRTKLARCYRITSALFRLQTWTQNYLHMNVQTGRVCLKRVYLMLSLMVYV